MSEPAAQLPATIAPIQNTVGLGKAMKAINPQQRAFVQAYVLAGSNGTRAAQISGYGAGNYDSARTAAYRLLHDQKILAAIKEHADGILRSSVLIGADVLVEIAQNVHHKDRFKAAQALLDRGGLIVATQSNISLQITEDTGPDQIIDRIKVLAGKLGLDPAVLLGRAATAHVPRLSSPDVVDAEFTEVIPAPSAAGLEDLL